MIDERGAVAVEAQRGDLGRQARRVDSLGNTLGIAIAGLIVFGLGWGFFDSNNMPILSQIARPEWRATGYGIMNMVSISCGGFGDWAFGALRDRDVPLNLIFGVFAGVALLSVAIVLMIRPRGDDVVATV